MKPEKVSVGRSAKASRSIFMYAVGNRDHMLGPRSARCSRILIVPQPGFRRLPEGRVPEREGGGTCGFPGRTQHRN